jgi:hypothetical protein
MTGKHITQDRLTIFENDLKQARKFAEYIIERGLCNKKGPRIQLVHLAFNTSLIISYCRPSHENRNAEGQPKSSLEPYVSQVLIGDDVKLHHVIKISRVKEYAHSDARAYSLDFDYAQPDSNTHPLSSSNHSIMRDPFSQKLKEPQLAILIVMIKKWITFLHERTQG